MAEPELLDAVRAYASQHLLGQEERFDSFAPIPLETLEEFRRARLANWWLPTEYGGLGLGLRDSVDIVSELSYADAGAAFTLFISVLGTTILSLYGGDELRKTYLTRMADGRGFCATLGSERDAGSELAKITTTATRHDDEVVLDGRKFFSTNTDFADFLVVLARDADQDAGHVAVVVPRDTPGIHIRKRWEMIGLRAAGTYEVDLDSCRVPADHVIGGPGLRLLEVGLNASRVLIAATAVGVARRVRDLCVDYAETKHLRDEPLAISPVFANRLGDMEMTIDVMRNQCLAAAAEFDDLAGRSGAPTEFLRRGTLKSALAAKMFCGKAGWNVADTGSQMFGGLGYTRELLIGKLVRDVRYVSIVEGGDDVLRELMYARYVVPPAKRT